MSTRDPATRPEPSALQGRGEPIRASQDARVTLAATIYAAQNAMADAICTPEDGPDRQLPGMDEAFQRADALLEEWGVAVDPPGDPVEELAAPFRRSTPSVLPVPVEQGQPVALARLRDAADSLAASARDRHADVVHDAADELEAVRQEVAVWRALARGEVPERTTAEQYAFMQALPVEQGEPDAAVELLGRIVEKFDNNNAGRGDPLWPLIERARAMYLGVPFDPRSVP